uniref:G_PROTEIN_RECEP_F1_2 domain-containing protein n=1 Tax=Steinernema glaseri TaxID=37863 RepID=A0A1I8AS36_9BILA
MSTNPTEVAVFSTIATTVALINVPVIVLIFTAPALKKCKELVLIGGVCGVDAVQNLFNAILNVDRYLNFPNGTNVMVPNASCFFRYYVVVLFYTQLLVGLAPLLVSLERCAVIFYPIWYTVSYTRKKALLIILGSLIFCFIIHVMCYIIVLNSPPFNISIICSGSAVYPPLAFSIQTSLRIVESGLGILLYVPISIRICQMKVAQQKHVFVPSNSSISTLTSAKKEAEIQMRRNIRFSITIGMTCLSDLILLFLPDIIINFDLFGFKAFHLYFSRSNTLKTVVNLFIYTLRHNELRKELMTRLRFWH